MSDGVQLCINCQKPLPSGAAYCPACGRPQFHTAPLWSGERRLVTVLFADLASFTAVSENADPEDVIDMLNQVYSRLMIECDREGGYLDKTVGDQMMVLFGAPHAHEDDPARAVRAALGMQVAIEELAPAMREKVGAACKLNIGINTGAVVWGQVGPGGRTAPTVIGDAVNLAARLQQSAKGGQIFVSETVYLRTRHLFEFKTLEPIRVKNKSGLIPVYMPLHLHRRVDLGHGSVDSKLPLLERQRELDSLQACWARAVSGYPQLILLSAEAGLGKSRLLTEFANSLDTYALDKQPLVLHTHHEPARNSQYAPLTNLLCQLFSLTAEDSDLICNRKVQDRARILGITGTSFLPLMGYLLGWYQDKLPVDAENADLEAIRRQAIEAAAHLYLAQSTHRPILLIIDDLHLADTNSLEWLRRLAADWEKAQQEYRHCRLMIVLGTRTQFATSQLLLPVNNKIVLSPLSDFARHELIAALLPGRGVPTSLVERLSRESGGNPFYLVESIRGLISSKQLVLHNGLWRLTRPDNQLEVPETVEGLVMAHLDVLNPVTRSVLQHAAVIGLHFSYTLLAAITEVNNLPHHLEELEQRGLISRVPDTGTDEQLSYMFAQAMVREVTYQSILRKTRRELHSRIAQLTEIKLVPRIEDLKDLAYHYAASGDQEKLIAYNWLTGRYSLEQFNFEEAYQHLHLAWTTLGEVGETNPTIYRDIADALADASTFTGHFAQAETCYRIAHETLDHTSDALARLYYKLGRLYSYQAEMATARQYYEQALEFILPEHGLRGQIEAELGLLGDGIK